jgi:hypothetical protein
VRGKQGVEREGEQGRKEERGGSREREKESRGGKRRGGEGRQYLRNLSTVKCWRSKYSCGIAFPGQLFSKKATCPFTQ